jgi:hypothetical protein
MEFDAIHVGAAAATVPDALVKMLRVGGRMIIPVGTSSQSMYMITRQSDGSYKSKNLMGVVYVPLVNTGQPNAELPTATASKPITPTTTATTQSSPAISTTSVPAKAAPAPAKKDH